MTSLNVYNVNMQEVNFIRIPKCASSSIYAHIGNKNTITDESMSGSQSYDKAQDIVRDWFNLHVFPGSSFEHFAYSYCSFSQAVSVLGSGILDNPSFAVCRNPYDRMVSQYFYNKKKLSSEHFETTFGVCNDDIEGLSNFINYCVDNQDIGYLSQSFYLNVDTEINILRFENLQNDFSGFVTSNNLTIDPTLPHLNENDLDSYTGSYMSYYTEASKNKVKELWEEDFERFGYAT